MIGRAALAVATASLVMTLSPAAASAAPLKIWIDPGHGGYDSGAEASGVAESTSNLHLAQLVEKDARRQGWDVGASRDNNTFVDLYARTAKASAFHADAFVSIHSNSTGGKSEGFSDIYQPGNGKSQKLADDIINRLDPLTSYKDIGPYADNRGLAVLRTAPMPAVLVEALSVDAATENGLLKRPDFQQQIADNIVHGIADYYGVAYHPADSGPAPKAAPQPAPAPKPAPQPAPAPKPAPAPQQAKATAPHPVKHSAAPADLTVWTLLMKWLGL